MLHHYQKNKILYTTLKASKNSKIPFLSLVQQTTLITTTTQSQT